MRLELSGLTVRYGGGAHALTAVDGIDLVVPAGATVGLVGESGCGKSTVARSIVGLVPIAAGQLLVDGKDMTADAARNNLAYRRRVQMVFQDPYASLNPRMTVGAMLVESLAKVAGTERPVRRSEALRLLELVGLPASALDRYPHQFSGGQRQRAAIARALAVRPELIIHDEVTSALDVSVQGTILNLLLDLQRELALSYLFISHDLATVSHMCQTVAVMYLGRIVETAPARQVFATPQHPYTQALIESLPAVGKPRRSAPLSGEIPDPRNPPPGCRFQTRCPVGPRYRPDRTICVESDPQTIAADRRHGSACHFVAERDELVPAGEAPGDTTPRVVAQS
jgi:peptide/nickel transport system ATP-binding protein